MDSLIESLKRINLLMKIKRYMFDIFVSDKFFYNYGFKKVFGRNVSWDKPKTFNEKIQWRKLYQRADIFSICSDKYLVRDFVLENSRCKLIPLIGVYDHWDDIDFDSLNGNYVIKTNHDSGSVCIVRDSKNIDINSIKRTILKSMKRDFGRITRERHYSKIKPKIVIEKLMINEDGTLPHDIKIHCFHGAPKFIQIASSDHTTNDFYDCGWKRIEVEYLNKMSKKLLPKPEKLEDILSIAKELSSTFDYIRVDLYEINHEIYFGELTFTPNNGLAKINPSSYDDLWGSYWIL